MTRPVIHFMNESGKQIFSECLDFIVAGDVTVSFPVIIPVTADGSVIDELLRVSEPRPGPPDRPRPYPTRHFYVTVRAMRWHRAWGRVAW